MPRQENVPLKLSVSAVVTVTSHPPSFEANDAVPDAEWIENVSRRDVDVTRVPTNVVPPRANPAPAVDHASVNEPGAGA